MSRAPLPPAQAPTVSDARPLSLGASDFELFQVPRRYAQDRAALDARWKALQREAHPDRFAAQGAASQRLAMQWSVRINEAYQRLKDPLQRARLLCEEAGAAIDAENNTAMPQDFLMQQMAWREALDDATSADAVEALLAEVQAQQAQRLRHCGDLIDIQQDFAAAAQEVRALMFVERFLQDVEARLAVLEDQPGAAPMSPDRGPAGAPGRQ